MSRQPSRELARYAAMQAVKEPTTPGPLPARHETPDPADPAVAARMAKLRYVSDKQPGIRRRREANGFTYLNPDGSEVTDEDTLARIRKLAIPPAYEDVWICRDPQRPSSGGRAGCARAQAVPLPPALAANSRRIEVRQDAGVRPGPAGDPPAGGGGSGTARAAA